MAFYWGRRAPVVDPSSKNLRPSHWLFSSYIATSPPSPCFLPRLSLSILPSVCKLSLVFHSRSLSLLSRFIRYGSMAACSVAPPLYSVVDLAPIPSSSCFGSYNTITATRHSPACVHVCRTYTGIVDSPNLNLPWVHTYISYVMPGLVWQQQQVHNIAKKEAAGIGKRHGHGRLAKRAASMLQSRDRREPFILIICQSGL